MKKLMELFRVQKGHLSLLLNIDTDASLKSDLFKTLKDYLPSNCWPPTASSSKEDTVVEDG